MAIKSGASCWHYFHLPLARVESGGGSNYLEVQFVQRNPPAGVTYTPQVSTNLISWSSDPANFLPVQSVASSNNSSLITLRLSGALPLAPARFVRIALEKQ